MSAIKKFVVGIRPHARMFRVTSNWGEYTDHVFGLRGSKPISVDYFDGISQNDAKQSTTLISEMLGNQLTISPSDIVFTKNHYDKQTGVSIEKALQEFQAIYRRLNEVLKVGGIRRIGLVAEYRHVVEDGAQVSNLLARSVTKLPIDGMAAKFNLSFERRYHEKAVAQFDASSDDFINVIWNIYDSEIDEEKEAGAYNFNCDFQRYYQPIFEGDVLREIQRLRKQFEEEAERTQNVGAKLSASGAE